MPSSQFLGASKNICISDMSLDSQRIFIAEGFALKCTQLQELSYPLLKSVGGQVGWESLIEMDLTHWTPPCSQVQTPVWEEAAQVCPCSSSPSWPAPRAGSCARPGKYQTLHLLFAEPPVPALRLALSREYRPKPMKKANSAFCLPVKSVLGQRAEPGSLEIGLHGWAFLPLHTLRTSDKKIYHLYIKKVKSWVIFLVWGAAIPTSKTLKSIIKD